MGRKITVIVEDEKTKRSFSGSADLERFNELSKHGINGLSQIAYSLNNELNTILEETVKLSLPNWDLNNPPPNVEW